MNVATQLVERLMTAAAPASSQNSPKTQETGKSSEFESLIREKTQVSDPMAKDAPAKEIVAAPANEEITELQQGLAAALITSQPATPVNILEVQTTAPAFDPATQTVITLEPQSTVELPAVQTELQQAAQPVIEQAPQTRQPTQPQPQPHETLETAPETQAPIQSAQTTQTGGESEQSSAEADSRKLSFTVEGKATNGQKTDETPLFENPEAVPVKVAEAPVTEKAAPTLETASPEAPEKLAKVISDSLENGETKLTIKLAPENLGEMTVEITRAGDGSLGVVLKTTTDKAASLLQQQSQSLQSILAAGTQATVKIEVQNQHQQDMEQFMNPNGQNGRENPQQQQSRQQKDPQQTQDFIQQLRLGLVDLNQPA